MVLRSLLDLWGSDAHLQRPTAEEPRVVFHYSGLLEADQFGGYTSQGGAVKLPQKLVTWSPEGATTSTSSLPPPTHPASKPGLVTWVPGTRTRLHGGLEGLGWTLGENSNLSTEATRRDNHPIPSHEGFDWLEELRPTREEEESNSFFQESFLTEASRPSEAWVKPKNTFYSKFADSKARLRQKQGPVELVWNGAEFVSAKEKEVKEEVDIIFMKKKRPEIVKYKNILNSYNSVSISLSSPDLTIVHRSHLMVGWRL